MCGISCSIYCKTYNGICRNNKSLESLDELLRHRGPDLSAKKFLDSYSSNCNGYNVDLAAHVLWTQGDQVVAQPFCNERNSKFLLFNGDIYSFGVESENLETDLNPENDGAILFRSFSKCDIDNDSGLEAFHNIVGGLKGPFAFIYYDQKRNLILFGRDFFGRESLLFSISTDRLMTVISSVSVYADVFEIPAAGIYYWNLTENFISLDCYKCHDRDDISSNLDRFTLFVEKIGVSLRLNKPSNIQQKVSTMIIQDSNNLCQPEDYPDKLKEIIQCAEDNQNNPSQLLEDLTVILDSQVTEFLQLLRNAVHLRVKCQPSFCKNCIHSYEMSSSLQTNCVCSKVAILFSGGLDSTVLAYIALESLKPGESLDLINVAFSKTDNFNNIPDRETGLESYKVLKRIFQPQGKIINFISVNIKKEEVELKREQIIRNLINPLTSVLDDSLGCCLWFAGRCSGTLHEQNVLYTSPARVALLGSGADELFGGYSRHRNAYKQNGWIGLASEMQQDIDRISIRNLGRDNRIVSDHGICPRMPYLDEDVVTFITGKCDIWVKCCPLDVGTLNQRGLGEKLLLRVSAVKLFGKDNATLALFPKRAMQFGSRIAKLENSKEKGGDECARLVNTIYYSSKCVTETGD